MDKDLDNANPTILSAAQMPTRQTKRIAPRKGPDAKYNDVILAKPAYLSRPFCDDDSLWPDRDVVDDDFAEEPIDEQEIYGERPLSPFLFLYLFIVLSPASHTIVSLRKAENWKGAPCRVFQTSPLGVMVHTRVDEAKISRAAAMPYHETIGPSLPSRCIVALISVAA